MKRKRVFLFNSVPLRCPDCKEPTKIVVSSLLGTANTSAYNPATPLFKHLLIDVKDRWQTTTLKNTVKHLVKCSNCSHGRQQVHWVILGVDHVVGPWCIRCLRYLVWNEIEGEKGLSNDLYVLGIAASVEVFRQLHNISIEQCSMPSGNTTSVF